MPSKLIFDAVIGLKGVKSPIAICEQETGATVSLYTNGVAEEVRPTDDIDVLVELVSYQGYADIEEKLRQKGVINDWESGVICRYKVRGIIVDVVTTLCRMLLGERDTALGWA